MTYIWLAIEVSSSLIEPIYYQIMCYILERSDKVLQDKINKIGYKIQHNQLSHMVSNDHNHTEGEERKTEEIQPVHRVLTKNDINNILNQGVRKTVKTAQMARMEELITSKVNVEFEEDFYAMTVLCYMKQNAEKYHITIDKQAQNLHNCLMILTVQLSMLVCMLYSIAT